MKAKALKYGLAALVLGAVVLAAAYQASYPIKLNMSTLPGHILDFYNRGYSTELSPTVTLYGGVEIGNRAYYLMELGEDLGSVTLKRGLTGRYQIEYLRYGGGNFRDGLVESEGKKYLLLGGRDTAARIARISVTIEGQTYELENPKPRDHFLLCTEIDARIQDNHIDRDRLRLYDEAGEDITALYDLSGGGI